MQGGGTAMADGVIANDRETGRFIGHSHALTEMQAAFVKAYVANGGNSERAAVQAGYADARTNSWKLRRNPAISSAIRTAQIQAIEDGSCTAWGTMMELMTGEGVPAPVRFQAAKWTLEASGHGLAAQALAAKVSDPENKPVSEMTVAELEEYVKRQQAAVEALKQAEGKVIDAT